MRFAFISDIHANLPAWEAVLLDIQELGIEHIINLGDIVGYGPNPKEVLESVREHSELSVIGNHDAVCAGTIDSSIFNDRARSAIEWTRQQLDQEDRAYLKEMPEKVRPEGQDFLITHAEVVKPLNFGYILTEKDAEKNFAVCDDQLIFIGHTHRPGAFEKNKLGAINILDPETMKLDASSRYIINPGSVGDPRCGDIAATYCIYDSEERTIEFRIIPFDTDVYRAALDASSLSESPFFVRYLESMEATSQTVTAEAPKMEGYRPPEINLSPAVPTTVETKKKKTGLILTFSLILLAGIGFGALKFYQGDKKASTEKPEPEKTAAKTDAPVKEILKAKKPQPTPLAIHKKPTPRTILTKKWPIMARYVKIAGPDGFPLVLAEVEVFSAKNNVARVKKVTQSSSRYKASYASRAIDGNRKGKNPNSLVYTTGESPTWWEVDLGKEYRIDAIHIWNREASPSVRKRLNGFYLILRNDAGETIYQRQHTTTKERLIRAKLR